MLRKLLTLPRSLCLLIIVLILLGCGPYFQLSRTNEDPPTPVLVGAKGGTEDPNVFTDTAAFQDALLKALYARDVVKLQAWMTDPLVTGTWRGDLANILPADAVKKLFAEELGANSRLTPIDPAEVPALMGGKDPRSLPRIEAGVTHAFLIGGWGKDGRDEALLFIAREKDNSLRLHGWMVVQGGFSGARLGGIRLYTNDAEGYQVYLPQGYAVSASGNQVAIVAPREGSDPGLAIIATEPAKGRTSEQVAAQVVKTAQAQLGPGAHLQSTSMTIENAQAVVITGLFGQDPNRQLFMVRGDRLYHMTFSPNDARAGKAYEQMQDLYAMIVNTFHFTR